MNIATVGFSKDFNINTDDYFFNHINYYVDGYKNGRELMIEIQRGIDNADIILINLNNAYLSADEIIVLYVAYSNNVPTYGVGDTIKNILVDEMLCRRFISIPEALEHIKNSF